MTVPEQTIYCIDIHTLGHGSPHVFARNSRFCVGGLCSREMMFHNRRDIFTMESVCGLCRSDSNRFDFRFGV